MTVHRSIAARVMAVVLAAGIAGGAVALYVATRAMEDTAEVRLVDEITAETDRARLAIDDRLRIGEAQLDTAILLAQAGHVQDAPAMLSDFIRAARVEVDSEVVEIVRDEAVRPLLPADSERRTRWLADGYLVVRVVVGDSFAAGVIDVRGLLPQSSDGSASVRERTAGYDDVAGVVVTRDRDLAIAEGALSSPFTLHNEVSLHGVRAEAASSIRHAVGWVVAATLIAAVVLAWMLSRRVTRPIRSLAAAVRRGGRELALPSLSRDEIGELGGAIATMHDELADDARGLAIGVEFARAVVRFRDPEQIVTELERALAQAQPQHGWRVQLEAESQPDADHRRPMMAPVLDDGCVVIPLQLDGIDVGTVVGRGAPSQRDLRSAEVLCHTALAAIKMARLTRVATINEKLALVGRMSAGIAHEINNPLSYVLLSLGELQEQLDGAQRELASEAIAGVNRVAQIIKDLSRLSRAGSDEVAAEDLAAIVADQVKIARTRGRSVRVDVAVDAAVWVRCARGRVGQAVLNLIVNAIDAVGDRAGGAVEISVRLDGDFGVVVVADNGPGIPEHAQKRLFDAFFSTKGDQGTGLGLYLSRQFVQLYGGRLELAATSGRGTAFEVRLPLCSLPQPATATPADAAVSPRRRVLVVDDEPLILRTLERWLSRHVDVLTATNGRDALDKLANGPFSLVLCDWNMPVMSGREFVAALRSHTPSTLDALVIMTGGNAEGTDGLRVLSKPLDRDVLQGFLGV